MQNNKLTIFTVTLILLVFFAPAAQANMYEFDKWGWVTGESGPTVMDQLSITVTDDGVDPGQILFIFSNSGPINSSITNVYFDDGELVEIVNLYNYGGVGDVVFLVGGNPGELPGASELDPHFETSTDFSAGPTSQKFNNGVNPGESLGVVFGLEGWGNGKTGSSFDDVILAIYLGFEGPEDYELDWWIENSLRIGVHVQGIGPDEISQTYIMNPVPGAMILGLLGLSVAGIKLRKYA